MGRGKIAQFLRSYIFTLIAFLALDSIWLNTMFPLLYSPEIGPLLTDDIRYAPVIVFYPLYVLALTLLAVYPANQSGKTFDAAWRGGLMGLAAYGAYDLTNMATLKEWSTLVTVADMIWGTVLGAASASIGALGNRITTKQKSQTYTD